MSAQLRVFSEKKDRQETSDGVNSRTATLTARDFKQGWPITKMSKSLSKTATL